MDAPPRVASRFLTQIRASLAESVGRFPALLLCALVWSGACAWSLHHNLNPEIKSGCLRLAMTAAVGVPLCFSLRLIGERLLPSLKNVLEWTALPLLDFYFWMLSKGWNENQEYVLRWGLLLLSLHFAASVAAFIHTREDGFWQFNRRVFQGFCVAALHTGVLLVGLEVALLSADKLFGLRLEKAYLDLFLFITGCVHPIFFLKRVPSDFDALARDNEYPLGLKGFTQFALAPLVAVFTLMLYAYGIKISCTQSWPNGWVSLPVLILSGVGIFAFLLLHPLRTRREEKWAYWFCFFFPKTLAPLSVLLLLAIRERTNAYGITEERYLGFVAGCSILLWALVTSFKKNAGLRWWPFLLGAVSLLCAFGPWSAGNVSLQSQMQRVTRFLETHSLLAGGIAATPEASLKLEAAELNNFRSTVRYVATRHGNGPLRKLFPQAFANTEGTPNAPSAWNVADNIITELRLLAGPSESKKHWDHFTLDTGVRIPLENYQNLLPTIDLQTGKARQIPDNSGAFWLVLKDGGLWASAHENRDFEEIPLQAFLTALPKGKRLSSSMLSAEWEYRGQQYRIIFTVLRILRERDSPPKIEACSLLLFQK